VRVSGVWFVCVCQVCGLCVCRVCGWGYWLVRTFVDRMPLQLIRFSGLKPRSVQATVARFNLPAYRFSTLRSRDGLGRTLYVVGGLLWRGFIRRPKSLPAYRFSTLRSRDGLGWTLYVVGIYGAGKTNRKASHRYTTLLVSECIVRCMRADIRIYPMATLEQDQVFLVLRVVDGDVRSLRVPCVCNVA
jgi:hypothetical protein